MRDNVLSVDPLTDSVIAVCAGVFQECQQRLFVNKKPCAVHTEHVVISTHYDQLKWFHGNILTRTH